jgi:Tfp pilus assembly protein PilX
MKKNRRIPGSALLITLALLVVVTILAVGTLSIVRLERVSARNSFDSIQAKAFSSLATDHALALLRDGITAAERTTTNASAGSLKFWASQPGRITVFNNDGTVDATSSRNLYSSNAAASGTVDINAALFDGSHPIIPADGSGSAPAMNVSWIPVLKDPSSSASSTNRLVGRYAFWVDDESTKLNINTADGSTKGADKSFGPGSPSEVNLKVLTDGGQSLTTEKAAAIAKQSGAQYDFTVRSRPFNSAREGPQAAGVTENLFESHSSDLTSYNRAPELNIFGEPRIYLTPVTKRDAADAAIRPLNNTPRSLITGPYPSIDLAPATRIPPASLYTRNRTALFDSGNTLLAGAHLDWIYPSSGVQASAVTGTPPNSQLPLFQYKYIDNVGATVTRSTRLPQFFHDEQVEYVSGSTGNPADGYLNVGRDYDLGYRIARYLKGYNSQGNPIAWPSFSSSGTGGFAGKYTDRQIDEMTLQILSYVKQLYPDHYYGHTANYLIKRGFLSGKPVRGLNRGPRLTEVLLKVTTIAGDPPQMKLQIVAEYYLPDGFKGYDLTFGDIGNWNFFINGKDVGSPGALGSSWADTMLQVQDAAGNSVGVDFMGNRSDTADPDQAKAALFHHPWALKNPALPHDGTNNPYLGTGLAPSFSQSTFSPLNLYTIGSTWKVGDYHSVINLYSSMAIPMKSGTTEIKLAGGLAIWMRDSAGRQLEIVPLDSEYVDPAASALARQTVLDAVIPIPNGPTIPVPGVGYYHMQVADPLVNNFPGDWEGEVLADPSSPKITMSIPPSTSPVFYADGKNTSGKPSAGADPATAWWPEQNLNVPKSRRFPSTGYLQYIHTGVMPDKEFDSKPLKEQKGTPFRILNFSPSDAASQQTAGGESYPDWALLDLFTTPAVFQPWAALNDPIPSPIVRTWGGATAGRLNPNAVLEPFGIVRTKPLEALFKDVPVSTAYNGSENPVSTVPDAAKIAEAITTFVKDKGPLKLPGQICNVPEVAAYVYTGVPVAAQSRNDLVRNTVGNLTTRSNTFTVWAVGESIKKKNGNTNDGEFESGDVVLGRSRMRYVVERYLDPGNDDTYGNAADPGPDGVVGTPDDPVTAAGGAHPPLRYPLPYKFRVVSASAVE